MSYVFDMMRYDRAWLYDDEDVQTVLKIFARDASGKVSFRICSLSDTKKHWPFTAARLPSDWKLEVISDPHLEGHHTHKLLKPVWYQHYARIEPDENWDGSFPLHLLTEEQASPLREGHSNRIERILFTLSGLYPKEAPTVLGLTKFTADKIGQWKIDAWKEHGWNLTPVSDGSKASRFVKAGFLL